MNFVHPYFLIGLVAVAIPVIIHLFNFRRYRRIFFSNIRYIKQVKLETQKKSQLRHLLILLMRILAIACLVFAFAQPYIPLSDKVTRQESKNAVSIYVDNSFSMQAISNAGTLLEEAKEKADEIAMAYKPSDLFQLLTNDFKRQHQRLLSREEFIDALDDVALSPAVKRLSEVLKRQEDILLDSKTEVMNAFLLSDFQKSIFDIDQNPVDTAIRIFIVPMMTERPGNLYIDSCWFENPVRQVNQPSKLITRITNISDIDYEKIPVKLIVNGVQKALASFNVGGNETTQIELIFSHYEPGIKHAVLQITDYPVTYDDKYFITYEVQSVIPVLSIYDRDPSPYLDALFGKDTVFIYSASSEKNLNYANLRSYHLIILDELQEISSGLAQELKRFIENGGSVTVFPAAEINKNSYNDFTRSLKSGILDIIDTARSRVSEINLEHAVFQDVFEEWPQTGDGQGVKIDLPIVLKHYRIDYPYRSESENLMTLQNGDPLLSAQPVGNGMIYLFASPLDPSFSNLSRHALYVPLMYKIALLSQPQYPLFYVIDEDEVLELNLKALEGDKVFKIRKIDGEEYEFIPEHHNLNNKVRIVMHNQIKDAGNFSLHEGARTVAGIAFNYDRKESNLEMLGEEELKGLLQKADMKNTTLFADNKKPIAQSLQELNRGIRLWKLFIIFALIFLASETIMLRFWK